MVFDERLCGGGEMHPVAIPEQDDVPGCEPQHLLEKKDDVVRIQSTPKGADTQADLPQLWTDEQGRQQVQPLAMVQTGADGGGLPTRRPGAFER